MTEFTTTRQCMICGNSYSAIDLRTSPVCPACTPLWNNAPRTIDKTKNFLTTRERELLMNNKTIRKGDGKDVRAGYPMYKEV